MKMRVWKIPLTSLKKLPRFAERAYAGFVVLFMPRPMKKAIVKLHWWWWSWRKPLVYPTHKLTKYQI